MLISGLRERDAEVTERRLCEKKARREAGSMKALFSPANFPQKLVETESV